MSLLDKIKMKLKQWTCSHYGPLGRPICHGYSFFVNEKTCHVCGAKVRKTTRLNVIERNSLPFDERLIGRDEL